MSSSRFFFGGPAVVQLRIVQAALFAALGVMSIILCGVKNSTLIRAGDFGQYYIASQRLRTGQPVYDLIAYGPVGSDLSLSEAGQGGAGAGVHNEDAFRPANPPPLILLFYPLAYLGYATAWWLVCVSSLLIVAGLTYEVGREVISSPLERLFWVAIALTSLPMLIYGALNHVEAFVWAIMVGGWVWLRQGRQLSAGIAFGVAGSLKLFPLVFIPLLFSSGFRRAGVAASASAVATFAVASLAIGLDSTAVFFEEVLPQAARYRFSLGNISLLSLLGWFLPSAGAFAVGAVFLGWTTLVARRCRTADQVFVLGISASLLCSPLSWTYYLVLALPCMMITSTWFRVSVHLRVRSLAWGLIVLLAYWPWILGGFMQVPAIPSKLHAGLNYFPTLGLLVLWAAPQFWFVVTSRSER